MKIFELFDLSWIKASFGLNSNITFVGEGSIIQIFFHLAFVIFHRMTNSSSSWNFFIQSIFVLEGGGLSILLYNFYSRQYHFALEVWFINWTRVIINRRLHHLYLSQGRNLHICFHHFLMAYATSSSPCCVVVRRQIKCVTLFLFRVAIAFLLSCSISVSCHMYFFDYNYWLVSMICSGGCLYSPVYMIHLWSFNL